MCEWLEIKRGKVLPFYRDFVMSVGCSVNIFRFHIRMDKLARIRIRNLISIFLWAMYISIISIGYERPVRMCAGRDSLGLLGVRT